MASTGPRGAPTPPEVGDASRRPGLAALLLAACALLPTSGAALAGDDEPLPPAELPGSALAEPSEASAPLHPTADALGGPQGATADVLERPGRSFFEPWLDVPHAFIERRIFDVVFGFDRFFADERDLDCLRPNSFLRWRNQETVRKDGSLDFATDLRADINLPYLERRLRRFRVVLENAGRGLAGSDPRSISGQREGGAGDAVLQWALFDTLRSSVDVGGGVLFNLPPGLVGRTRFRYARALGPVALARMASTGFWNTRDGFGFNASVALERSLARPLLLRWTTGTLVTQASAGYESASSVALLATLGRSTALTLLGSVVGHSKPEPVIAAWRVATRLRTALLRRWIYGELEPEVRWPLDAAGGRRPTPAVMFRIELQFEDSPPPAAPASSPTPPPDVPKGKGCAVES